LPFAFPAEHYYVSVASPMSQTKAPAAKRGSWWNPSWSWKVWVVVAALLLPTFLFALWVLAEAGGQTKIDPSLVAIAGQNSGGPVTAITGTEHTVYHSNQPLPSASSPRDDGKLTLVWFTSTTCAACEDELFVHQVMVEFEDVMFAEKEIAREPGAQTLGVTSVPTFVWLDANGNDLGRFDSAGDADSFRSAVEAKRAAN